MLSAELAIILLNVIVILFAYVAIYPKVAGNSFNKIAFYDLFVFGFVLAVVGAKFWGSGQEFDLLVADVNWFWFTFVSYSVLGLPAIVAYCKIHKVDVTFDKER